MGRGRNPEKSAAGMISSVPLVGWGVISLKKCRYWGAALPPDDRMPQAAIEWVRFPSIFIYSNKKSPTRGLFLLEQMTGIEPAYSAWEADVLPLNYICVYLRYYYSTAVPSLSITQK